VNRIMEVDRFRIRMRGVSAERRTKTTAIHEYLEQLYKSTSHDVSPLCTVTPLLLPPLPSPPSPRFLLFSLIHASLHSTSQPSSLIIHTYAAPFLLRPPPAHPLPQTPPDISLRVPPPSCTLATPFLHLLPSPPSPLYPGPPLSAFLPLLMLPSSLLHFNNS